jgi:hypothetical protein
LELKLIKIKIFLLPLVLFPPSKQWVQVQNSMLRVFALQGSTGGWKKTAENETVALERLYLKKA